MPAGCPAQGQIFTRKRKPALETLRFISIQAPNQDGMVAELSAYLGNALGLPVELVPARTWQERERLLDAGMAQVGWICGLSYIWKAARVPRQIELLAAPVHAASRYIGQAIYFSDVIVRADSACQVFEDLRGAVWAYNEPNSHSGYNLCRAMLAQKGLAQGFFAQVVAAGSHQKALKMVLEGQINAAAIDSTVLEIELERYPWLQEKIRVIETWGPSPAPPFVVRLEVPDSLRQEMQDVLLGMALEENGQAVLSRHHLRGFARVTDGDYDPIRLMEKQARRVSW
jgi:phosphonate transport system substrate-binding protein